MAAYRHGGGRPDDAEILLSGSGLVRLHEARQRAAGRDPGPTRAASAITACALADKASAEAASVRHFLTLLARFAGDLALVFLARGGVTFSGGIVPRLVELLDPASFRAAFEAKAPHHPLMQKIGTRLISHGSRAGRHGGGRAASRPLCHRLRSARLAAHALTETAAGQRKVIARAPGTAPARDHVHAFGSNRSKQHERFEMTDRDAKALPFCASRPCLRASRLRRRSRSSRGSGLHRAPPGRASRAAWR